MLSRLWQQRLDTLRRELQDQFDKSTSDLRNTEDCFHQYAETSREWFWELDAERVVRAWGSWSVVR
ncbi:MAG: hypothetical protein GY896_13145 [Gammaproteobacteria bacterium]|nr:hypothetical protein [Gammaproteobacteria bacterium]